jgi:hypothetical protein
MAGEIGTATKKMGDMPGKIESMTNWQIHCSYLEI